MTNKYNKEYLRIPVNSSSTKPVEKQIIDNKSRTADAGKTVKQLADELGISKQAIHKRLKSDLSTSLQEFTTIVDGVIYISVDGEKLLKKVLSNKNTNNQTKQVDGNVDGNIDSKIIYILEKNIDSLQRQLEQKDRQIEQLQKLLDQQQQLTLIDRNKIKKIESKSHWWRKKN